MILVVLFWLAAAVLVAAAHIALDPQSVAAGSIVTIAVVLGAAFCYTRFCARHAGSSHALGVGIAWLGLTIAAEIAMTRRVGHGWFALLGSPERPLLRNIVLFLWVFGPVLFAHREDEP